MHGLLGLLAQLGQQGQVVHGLLGARNTDRTCMC